MIVVFEDGVGWLVFLRRVKGQRSASRFLLPQFVVGKQTDRPNSGSFCCPNTREKERKVVARSRGELFVLSLFRSSSYFLSVSIPTWPPPVNSVSHPESKGNDSGSKVGGGEGKKTENSSEGRRNGTDGVSSERRRYPSSEK